MLTIICRHYSMLIISVLMSKKRKLMFSIILKNRISFAEIEGKEVVSLPFSGEWRFVPPFTNIWQHDRVIGMKILFWWFFAGVRKRNFFRDLWRGGRKWILFLKIIPDVRNSCCTEDRNRKSKISLPDRFKVQNRMSFAVSDIVLKIVTTNIECHL